MWLGLGWLRAVAPSYNYNCNKIQLGSNFQKNVMRLGNNIGLGFGWLRAVAQSYNYNYNTIELGGNFTNNLKNLRIQLGWGLDGCARWRTVTDRVAVKLTWEVIFKII